MMHFSSVWGMIPWLVVIPVSDRQVVMAGRWWHRAGWGAVVGWANARLQRRTPGRRNDQLSGVARAAIRIELHSALRTMSLCFLYPASRTDRWELHVDLRAAKDRQMRHNTASKLRYTQRRTDLEHGSQLKSWAAAPGRRVPARPHASATVSRQPPTAQGQQRCLRTTQWTVSIGCTVLKMHPLNPTAAAFVLHRRPGQALGQKLLLHNFGAVSTRRTSLGGMRCLSACGGCPCARDLRGGLRGGPCWATVPHRRPAPDLEKGAIPRDAAPSARGAACHTCPEGHDTQP